ncbi:TetR/AcrR family transcriptional regulator [Aeromicrobium sp.]|uniref:TetR/AcrR family transcriptional regulator n=1 Tax=Aeromicrobium sp. TaxID=1871063 RepID=UPI003D6A525F
MTSTDQRPYHHGHLRQVVIDAAVAEVQAAGASALSLRAIARRAGVSHAAPAHHFGDKKGIFTAIAIEGFDLLTAAIAPVAFEDEGFLAGGVGYVQFALEHPGHFEVMFRPTLYDRDDPKLVEAGDRAFEVLADSARHAIELQGTDDDAEGLAIAGWCLSHGLSTLWLQSNLVDKIGPDPFDQISRGVVALGEIVRRAQVAQTSPDS